MLARLFGRNFRSLKSDFELSLVAADLSNQADRDRGVIDVPIDGFPEPLRLLRGLAIYGPNASGKSTVLMAANAISRLVTESMAWGKPDAKIPPYEPFLLDTGSRGAPTLLGCDVVLEQTLLRYEIEFTAYAIVRETLTAYGGGGEAKLIDRQATGEVRGTLIAKNRANQLYVREMQPNVAVLSKLAILVSLA